MPSNKDLQWSSTQRIASSGVDHGARPRTSIELDHDVPMSDAPTPSITRFDERASSEHAPPEHPRPARLVDQARVSTSAPALVDNGLPQRPQRTLDVSMYLSALAYVAQLRTQNATLTFQNQTLQHHLTLHRSHLSFVLRDRVNATRLSSVVAEQLSQMEASHERLLGVHYSSTCGLRRDEYCKLLIDHHQTQKQFRRLHSSHQLLRYRFQHLVIQMAVTYVKNPPVRPIQVVFVNHSRPLTSLFVSSQQDPSSSFPIQAQPAPVSAPLQVIRPPPHSRVPAEGVHPPDVPSPSKTPRERARSDTAPSPPDLYYPPSPTVAPALNNEPGDGDGSSGSSSSSIDYTTRSASERLVEVAAFVQLIEKKIPYNNGQRKCIICGETLTLSSAFTGGNFQILSEHLRADHPRCLEKLSM